MNCYPRTDTDIDCSVELLAPPRQDPRLGGAAQPWHHPWVRRLWLGQASTRSNAMCVLGRTGMPRLLGLSWKGRGVGLGHPVPAPRRWFGPTNGNTASSNSADLSGRQAHLESPLRFCSFQARAEKPCPDMVQTAKDVESGRIKWCPRPVRFDGSARCPSL